MYFHVITDGGVGNLTAKQIDAQIAVLNKTFGGREGGFRTNFSFTLAGVTRTDNAAWFAPPRAGTSTMKQSLRQGGNDALNVYTSMAGVYLGWAYLPDILTKPGTGASGRHRASTGSPSRGPPRRSPASTTWARR